MIKMHASGVVNNAGYAILEAILTLAIAAIVTVAVNIAVVNDAEESMDIVYQEVLQAELQESIDTLREIIESMPEGTVITSHEELGKYRLAYAATPPDSDIVYTIVYSEDDHTLMIDRSGSDLPTWNVAKYQNVQSFSIVAEKDGEYSNFADADALYVKVSLGYGGQLVQMDMEINLWNRKK